MKIILALITIAIIATTSCTPPNLKNVSFGVKTDQGTIEGSKSGIKILIDQRSGK